MLEYNLVKLFFHMHPEENEDLVDPQRITSPTNTTIMRHSHPNISHSKISDNLTSSPMSSTNQYYTHNDDVAMSDETNVKKDHPTNSKSHSPSKNDDHKACHQHGQTTILNYFRRVDPPTCSAKKSAPENSILSSYFSDPSKPLAEEDFNAMEKKLRIFCQFSTAEDHNALIRNLAREKELKLKIKELLEKRKKGIASQTSDPCWRLLSESEKRLCRSSNLKPKQYISFKTSLIKDHRQKKKKGSALKLPSDGNIDKNVKRRIVDFLTRNNWIKV